MGWAVMALKLIIGNKNYSSWSMRPWIAMKVAGIAFEETVISLDAPDFKPACRRGLRHRQGAGADRRRRAASGNRWRSWNIWPRNFPTRACGRPTAQRGRCARAISSEMHAGFLPLRRHMPMNMWRPVKKRELTPEAEANVKRIETIWTDCRARFGAKARSFSVRPLSAPPTRCMRRWWRAFTHMACAVGAGVARLYGGGDGAASLARMVRSGDQGAVGAGRG